MKFCACAVCKVHEYAESCDVLIGTSESLQVTDGGLKVRCSLAMGSDKW